MLYAKEQIGAQVNTQSIANFLVLLGIATLLPFYIHLQWVTGPIVNAILILTLFLIGIRSALVVCLIPSLMALAGGLLPAILAPVVPFIMIGNVILVLAVDWFYNKTKSKVKGYWLGVLAGACFKFLFLTFSVSFIGKLLINQSLTVKVSQMMNWPQLATAVTGGMIAWIIIKRLKNI